MLQTQKKRIARLVGKIEDAKQKLVDFQEELEYWREQRSEKWLASELAEEFDDELRELEDFYYAIEDAIEEIRDNMGLEDLDEV